MLWTGIALGVFLATEAVLHGLVLPLSLGVLADAALTFLLIVALAVVLGELTRRHHRTVLRHGGRLSSAGGQARAPAWQHRAGVARGEGRSSLGAARAPSPCRSAGSAASRKVPRPKTSRRKPTDPPYSFGHACQQAAWPVPSLEEATARARQMSAGGEPYVVTEYPPGGGPGRTVATYVYGKPSQPTEGSTTMPPSRISTGHRAQRAARTGAAGIPSEWAAVVGQTADFEPENDGELLDWMGRQVTGLSAWAEALVDTYEHCTQVIGIDPQASAMLHDVADAAAQAAETMSAAKAKFTEHYELPREFAANGGLMTHDGRWVTGEGA